jgi:hypothetical protein
MLESCRPLPTPTMCCDLAAIARTFPPVVQSRLVRQNVKADEPQITWPITAIKPPFP